MMNARIPDPTEPQRAPDGYSDDQTFFFWLGDDAPTDDGSDGEEIAADTDGE